MRKLPSLSPRHTRPPITMSITMTSKLLTRATVTLLAVLVTTPARADMGPIPGEERFEAGAPSTTQSVGAALGFAEMDGDYFAALTLKSELNFGAVGLGLQVPLNLRVYDNEPKVDNDYFGLIRHADWDQASEFLKVVRYVRLGHKRDSFYLRAGELAADLGHGTIVGRYLNNLDTNTLRVGVAFDVNMDYGGIETLVSDYGTLFESGNPGSRIFGTRLYVKPIAFTDPGGALDIFALGFTIASDVNAPLAYQLTADTDPVTGLPVTPTPVVEDGVYAVDRKTAVTVYGFDVEAEVLHNAFVDLVPYSDLNFMVDAGSGWHLGVLTTFKMPVGFELTVPLRLEYRRFAARYRPTYFDTFYEVQRYVYGTTNPAQPKIAVVRAQPTDESINGYYADLAFDFMGLLQLGAVYEDYDGADPNLQAFVIVPALETIQLKAFYARNGVTSTSDIFRLDNRSFAVVEARLAMGTGTYLVGRVTRQWQLETDSLDPDYGQYVSRDEWQFGMELALVF